MSLFQIVMRLARNPGYPDGDDQQGYTIIAPLDREGRLNVEEWRDNREACTVIRFKPGEERDADGRLSHNGSHWFFHYDEVQEGEDEPVHRLQEHRLDLGDYVTIHESDGNAFTYRITQVQPYRPVMQKKA